MNLIERISAMWANFLGSPEMMVAMSVSVLVFSVLYYYMMKPVNIQGISISFIINHFY